MQLSLGMTFNCKSIMRRICLSMWTCSIGGHKIHLRQNMHACGWAVKIICHTHNCTMFRKSAGALCDINPQLQVSMHFQVWIAIVQGLEKSCC